MTVSVWLQVECLNLNNHCVDCKYNKASFRLSKDFEWMEYDALMHCRHVCQQMEQLLLNAYEVFPFWMANSQQMKGIRLPQYYVSFIHEFIQLLVPFWCVLLQRWVVIVHSQLFPGRDSSEAYYRSYSKIYIVIRFSLNILFYLLSLSPSICRGWTAQPK